jgi:hypothetical protein
VIGLCFKLTLDKNVVLWNVPGAGWIEIPKDEAIALILRRCF